MPSVAGLHIDVFDVEQEWRPDAQDGR
jgi:hypothetical protein